MKTERTGAKTLETNIRNRLNDALGKIESLVAALRDAEHALAREDAQTVRRTGAHDVVTVGALVRARVLLAELGEQS